MINIEKVKRNGFLDHYNLSPENKNMIDIANKNRPQDIKGVWKATECYEITITKDEIKEIDDFVKSGRPNYGYHGHHTRTVIEWLQSKKLLPKEKVFVPREEWEIDAVSTKANGFLDFSNSVPYHKEYIDTGVFHVFVLSDFEQLPVTKKEQEIIDNLDKRSRMESLNYLAVGQEVAKILRDNGYETSISNYHNGKALYFTKIKGYNKLIVDAIQYFLNNKVLKDLGVEIIMPKQKSTHGFKYTDILCYIGDMKMLLEENKQGE